MVRKTVTSIDTIVAGKSSHTGGKQSTVADQWKNKVSQMCKQLSDMDKKLDDILNILMYQPGNGPEYIKAKERFTHIAKMQKKE